MSDSPKTPTSTPTPTTSIPQTVQVPRFDIVTRDFGRTNLRPPSVVTEKK